MKLFIENGTPDDVKEDITRDFNYIVDRMGIRDAKHNLYVKFFYEKPMERKKDGFTRFYYRGGLTADYGNKKIVMKLNAFTRFYEIDPRISGGSFMNTFRHEMGHVWQIASGRLVSSSEPIAYAGKKFFNQVDPNTDGVNSYNEYEQQPWEVEAREFAAFFTKELEG